MLISCKCLNFIASSSNCSHQRHQLQKSVSISVAAAATADALAPTSKVTATTHGYDDCRMSSSTSNGAGFNVTAGNSNSLSSVLMHAFLQKYQRNFVFYSQCMDFFKQAIGPINDLTINALNQRDLVYSLTLHVADASNVQSSWQVSICINCNTALCAKQLRISGNPPQFLVNSSLITSNEELSHRRADKSFSDTFGVLIMDHPQLIVAHKGSVLPANATISASVAANDTKLQRLRQLNQNLQQRRKIEIAETDERIQRYTEQQFALLKNFREKSEQEYQLLVRLIHRVPEQQENELLDLLPPALEVCNNGVSSSFATGRRRNTIGSRRELNATPTTPTSIANLNFLPTAAAANMITTATTITTPSAIDTINTQVMPTLTNNHNSNNNNNNNNNNNSNSNNNSAVTFSSGNRKLSNFDTPPATPEATPMSVGNSPTFKQQQQQQQQQLPQTFVRLASSQSFQQQFPTPTIELGDDCLFEMEAMDTSNFSINGNGSTFAPVAAVATSAQLGAHPFTPHFHRINSNNHHHQHENIMSDLDESDGGEGAEDAIDLDSSMPILMQDNTVGRPTSSSQAINFAKSLPIAIEKSPMERSLMPHLKEDELDNTVDIAASIKALAKSVHGEAVFGDLPRPRLRSQI